jgi:hypothetical protein
LGQQEKAISFFRKSLKAYTHPENPSLNALKQLGVSD